MPLPTAVPIGFSDDEREQLPAWSRRPSSAQAIALISLIVLACAPGAPCISAIDGGTGSFGSSEVFEALADDEARDDLIADLSFDSDEPCATYTDPAGADLVAFRIGADGRYLTRTGRTATDDVACLLTDFGATDGSIQP